MATEGTMRRLLACALVGMTAAGPRPAAAAITMDEQNRTRLESELRSILRPETRDRRTAVAEVGRLPERLPAAGGTLVAKSSLLGAVAVRDQTVSDLRAFQTRLRELHRTRLGETSRELLSRSGPVFRAFEKMMEARARTTEKHREGHEAILKQANALDAAGPGARDANGLGAADYRERAANTPYGAFRAAQQDFFARLDEAPILGLQVNGQYLFQALQTTQFNVLRDTALPSLVGGFLLDGAEQAERAIADAEGVSSIEGLLKYGSIRYQRQQQAASLAGGPFVAGLVSDLQGTYTVQTSAREADEFIQNGLLNLGLGFLAAGSILIPIAGPAIALGVTTIQVFRDGNELVVAYLDEKKGDRVAPVTSYVHKITDEERTKAAAGAFVLSVVGVVADIGALAGEIKAIRTVGVGAAPAVGVAARSGALEKLVAEFGQEFADGVAAARRLGIPESQIEQTIAASRLPDRLNQATYTKLAKVDEGRIGIAAAARRRVETLADLDKVIAKAREAGLSEGTIQAALEKAKRRGTIDAFAEGLPRELVIAEFNGGNGILVTSPDELAELADFALGAVPTRVSVDPNAFAELESIGAKVKIANSPAGAGVTLTAEEWGALNRYLAENRYNAGRLFRFDEREGGFIRIFDDQFAKDLETFLEREARFGNPQARAALARPIKPPPPVGVAPAVAAIPRPPNLLINQGTGAFLTPAEIAKLTPAQLRTLPVEALNGLPDDVAVALVGRIRQVIREERAAAAAANLPPPRAPIPTQGKLELDITQGNAVNPGRPGGGPFRKVEELNPERVPVLTDDELGSITSEQFNALPPGPLKTALGEEARKRTRPVIDALRADASATRRAVAGGAAVGGAVGQVAAPPPGNAPNAAAGNQAAATPSPAPTPPPGPTPSPQPTPVPYPGAPVRPTTPASDGTATETVEEGVIRGGAPAGRPSAVDGKIEDIIEGEARDDSASEKWIKTANADGTHTFTSPDGKVAYRGRLLPSGRYTIEKTVRSGGGTLPLPVMMGIDVREADYTTMDLLVRDYIKLKGGNPNDYDYDRTAPKGPATHFIGPNGVRLEATFKNGRVQIQEKPPAATPKRAEAPGNPAPPANQPGQPGPPSGNTPAGPPGAGAAPQGKSVVLGDYARSQLLEALYLGLRNAGIKDVEKLPITDNGDGTLSAPFRDGKKITSNLYQKDGKFGPIYYLEPDASVNSVPATPETPAQGSAPTEKAEAGPSAPGIPPLGEIPLPVSSTGTNAADALAELFAPRFNWPGPGQAAGSAGDLVLLDASRRDAMKAYMQDPPSYALPSVAGLNLGAPMPVYQNIVIRMTSSRVPAMLPVPYKYSRSLERVRDLLRAVFPAPDPIRASRSLTLLPVRGRAWHGGANASEASAIPRLTITHQAPACVLADAHPRLEACAAPADDADRAQVWFRSRDDEPWRTVNMRREGGCFGATLPKPTASLPEFQYFIAMTTRDGAVALTSETSSPPVHRPRVVKREADCGRGLSVARVVKAGQIVLRSVKGGLGVPAGFGAEGVTTPSGAVNVSLVATGASTGAVFQLQAVNATDEPVELTADDALVVQPVQPGALKPLAATVKDARVHVDTVTGYCADFAKPPPPPGTSYRVAEPAIQQRLRPLRHVLKAGRELADAGRLHPDSEPKGYADSITQWAIWSQTEGWDEAAFGREFVERTKKNVVDLKKPWSKALEQAVRSAIPNRWRDITMVLDEARKASRPAAGP